MTSMDLLFEFEFIGWSGLLLYWLPMLLCLAWYTFDTIQSIESDKVRVAELKRLFDGLPQYNGLYRPEATFKRIILRVLVSVLPVVNLIALVFDVAADVCSLFMKWFDRVFDVPIVPKD